MNEIKKMQTPWDSDKILMVDVGCYERGCVCVANQWDANYQSECVPMVEYKEWVGLTEYEIKGVLGLSESWVGEDCSIPDMIGFAKAIDAKLKEKNT